MTKPLLRTLAVVAAPLLVGGVTGGCVHVKSDPVEVKPIEINVNVRIQIERELDDFFKNIDAQDATIQTQDE